MDEPFIGGVDFIADDDVVSEVPAIVDDDEVKAVNVSGLLTEKFASCHFVQAS